MSTERRILLGRVAGDFGVRGELKLLSWTDPRDAIFRYQPWILRAGHAERVVSGVRGRDTGKLVIASFPGVENREQAEALKGAEIWVLRSQLPEPKPGEYYWVDLEGLAVRNVEGVDFGRVSHLFDTGANPVLVAVGDRERLIPFVTDQYVKSVDFDAGVVVVDWDPDF